MVVLSGPPFECHTTSGNAPSQVPNTSVLSFSLLLFHSLLLQRRVGDIINGSLFFAAIITTGCLFSDYVVAVLADWLHRWQDRGDLPVEPHSTLREHQWEQKQLEKTSSTTTAWHIGGHFGLQNTVVRNRFNVKLFLVLLNFRGMKKGQTNQDDQKNSNLDKNMRTKERILTETKVTK